MIRFTHTATITPSVLRRASAAALLALVLAACGDSGGSTTSGAAASAQSGDAAMSANLQIIDKVKFQRAELKIAKGSSVEFSNKDNQAHTATADDQSFDTGLLAAGAATSVKFERTGTFAYHCSLHPFMTARVVVT